MHIRIDIIIIAIICLSVLIFVPDLLVQLVRLKRLREINEIPSSQSIENKRFLHIQNESTTSQLEVTLLEKISEDTMLVGNEKDLSDTVSFGYKVGAIQKDYPWGHTRDSNPFYLLGAYPEFTSIYREFQYNRPTYKLYNDQDYCDRVDFYNLQHPENLFEHKNFWTDFPENRKYYILYKSDIQELPRKRVMNKIGKVFNENPKPAARSHLSEKINSFFLQYSIFHYYHKIGTHFLCATQMYNHIPNQEVLGRKDQIIDKINQYVEKYKERAQCFNKTSLAPYTYRLYVENECRDFFNIINSNQYKQSLQTEAIQYLIKIGNGAHKSQGVFLLDKEYRDKINFDYNAGSECGFKNDSLLAQTYISNPLLLDLNNKFDFRVYMLIASTNPLIVYYHDGFLKLSLSQYEKTSTDKATHLTNTYLANIVIEEAKKQNKTINGMTESQLKDYILWDFEKFQKYLLESKKIIDPKWLDNYLRPAFHRAFIHLVRATRDSFWKQSNVYALHGVDFMLDDDMNLWFIESNVSPLLTGTSKSMIYYQVLMSHFEIQYAYLKSRMKRTLAVISRLQSEIQQGNNVDIEKWKSEYQIAAKNRLEPEFVVSKDNSFHLVMDENLPHTEAYFDYISEDCL